MQVGRQQLRHPHAGPSLDRMHAPLPAVLAHHRPSRPLGTTTTAQIRHDFGRLRVYPPSSGTLQAHLTVSTPGNPAEQEADRVADQILHMPDGPPRPRRSSEARTGGNTSAPPLLQPVFQAPGEPLDAATRAFFEPRFGHTFSAIRVHTGTEAARAAQMLDAAAFTVGHRIVFGAGSFAPQHAAGRHLLAHELVHTVQQGAAGQPVGSSQAGLVRAMAFGGPLIQRRTLGLAGSCWFENCQTQLQNFWMIPEDGPPGFHPAGTGSSFRVDDVDGLWFKFHSPKQEWFKIPGLGTGRVTCTDDETAPEIAPAAIVPFVTAGWTMDRIHTPNPYDQAVEGDGSDAP